MNLISELKTVISLLRKIAMHVRPKQKKGRGRPFGAKNKKKNKNEIPS